MTIFILAIIFLSSFLLYGNGGQLCLFKEIGGLLVMISFLIWWLWKHNKYLALFCGWVFLRAFMPPEQPRMQFELSNIIVAIILYLGIRNLNIDVKKIYKGLCLASFIQIVAVLMQKVNIFPFWNASWDNGRVWGLFGNSNFSGAFIAITIPFFLETAKTDKRYLLGLLGIPALIILDSQFALMAGLSGILLYLYIDYRSLIKRLHIDILLLTGITTAALYLIYNPIYLPWERFEVWSRICQFMVWGGNVEWRCHFLQGWGVGSGYQLIPMLSGKISVTVNLVWLQAHNEFIQAFLQYGIIGITFIGLIIFDCVKRFNVKNLVLYCGILALMVDACGFFPFRASPIGYMGVIYLALIDKG